MDNDCIYVIFIIDCIHKYVYMDRVALMNWYIQDARWPKLFLVLRHEY